MGTLPVCHQLHTLLGSSSGIHEAPGHHPHTHTHSTVCCLGVLGSSCQSSRTKLSCLGWLVVVASTKRRSVQVLSGTAASELGSRGSDKLPSQVETGSSWPDQTRPGRADGRVRGGGGSSGLSEFSPRSVFFCLVRFGAQFHAASRKGYTNRKG